ncbi:MAG: DUF982 domain-containing protein [Rhizobiaceae bacterium]
MTSRHQFDVPVFVVFHDEQERISSVADAMDFLHRWPLDRRGPIYRTAVNACAAVKAGRLRVDDGRRAFIGFARATNIFDRDMPGIEIRSRTVVSYPKGTL